jgi:hypothetical protein
MSMRWPIIVLVLVTLPSCSDLRRSDAASPQSGTYGSGIVQEVAKGRVKNPGMLFSSEIWEYVVRDLDGVELRIRSFSAMHLGDCVRFARDWPKPDNPIERLTPDQCKRR